MVWYGIVAENEHGNVDGMHQCFLSNARMYTGIGVDGTD
jgi:hypothetical protein